ncbi:MAG: hypothetical protein V4463_13170 [Pseudomonadota bacterium]
MDRRLLEYSPILEIRDSAGDVAGAEEEEFMLAADLLDARDERALDQVLHRTFAAKGILGARVARSPMGPQLISELKRAIRQLMPVQRSTIVIGTQPAALALGLELEGLSPEDKEFAVARQLVRFAGEAARHAASCANARAAVRKAARSHAPGLLAQGQQGRWHRQGQCIVVLDC